eukprot:3158259-Pyramimonas_sp.AAC.1
MGYGFVVCVFKPCDKTSDHHRKSSDQLEGRTSERVPTKQRVKSPFSAVRLLGRRTNYRGMLSAVPL